VRRPQGDDHRAAIDRVEISRQIAGLKPKSLILFEKHENSL
jgi:hypothetical protein